MSKTEEALLDVVKNIEVNVDREQLNSYERALTDFKALISQGYTKSRGYNLQTIDDCVGIVAFNAKI